MDDAVSLLHEPGGVFNPKAEQRTTVKALVCKKEEGVVGRVGLGLSGI